jgi:tRNA-2-methylthio-N6-dimethylallyladenosine synthase
MSGLIQLRRERGPVAPETGVAGTEARGGAVGARRVYLETYGCQMNVADSEMMLGVLGTAGYAATSDPGDADLILINTCAVRDNAEERVFARASILKELKQRNPRLLLGIAGCMAEHLKEKIHERAPYVDLIVGPDGYRRLGDHLAKAAGGEHVRDTVLDRDETYDGLDPVRVDDAGVRGRVTIQRGCDKFCTFCVVPYTRGRERGVAPREILRQVRALAADGCKEVQLLGQTVNSYHYEDVGFAELLRSVAQVEGIERVRFMSPYPLDFSPAVIQAMAETDKICKYVHLPLQTASDTVLGRMRRGYTYAEFKQLVLALRAAMPGIAITTDILVGFCDETEEEFAANLDALEELRFEGAFLFAYSEREGTYAARKLPDSVPEPVKQRRLAEAIAVQRRITSEIHAAQVGTRDRVLIEGVSKRSQTEFLGRTETLRSVIVPAGPGVELGALLDVVIERANTATLFGRVIDDRGGARA